MSKQQYRSEMGIMGDILDVTADGGRTGVIVSAIYRKATISPYDYSLLMPKNSVIVVMSALPINMDLVDEQTKLDLTTGLSEINYIFSATINPINKPEIPNESPFNYVNVAVIGGPIIAAVIGAVLMLKRKQQKSSPSIIQTEPISEKQIEIKPSDT